MANDCLVTKLRGEVINPNLDKFGFLGFEINSENGGSLSILPNSGKTLNMFTTDGSNKLRIGTSGEYSNSINIGAGATIYFAPGNYRVNLAKEELSGFGDDLGTGNGNALGLKLDLTDIQFLNLTRFAVNNATLGGELTCLSKVSSVMALYNSKFAIYENAPFKDLAKLLYVQTHNSMNQVFRKTNIKGSIESFVAAIRKEGIDEGSKSFSFVETNESLYITFQGIRKNGTVSFSWAANALDNTKTDVTCGGVTITIDADGEPTGPTT